MKDTTNEKGIHPLIEAVFTLLVAHRAAFRQERTYQRSVGLLFGEIFNFARHTVTQGLLALGITEGDWSAWYRLFSQKRFEEEKLANSFL